MFVVVSYDIPDDRRRARLSKALLSFGDRVQFSVFECNLETDELERMKKRIAREIDPSKDAVRLYRLCEGCRRETILFGLGKISEDPDLVIV